LKWLEDKENDIRELSKCKKRLTLKKNVQLS
jgi:hypothetical protein